MVGLLDGEMSSEAADPGLWVKYHGSARDARWSMGKAV
jgi:hypothetical protein